MLKAVAVLAHNLKRVFCGTLAHKQYFNRRVSSKAKIRKWIVTQLRAEMRSYDNYLAVACAYCPEGMRILAFLIHSRYQVLLF